MNKIIYLIGFLIGGIFNSYAQADIRVEEEATVVKTITIGEDFEDDGEIVITDTGGLSGIDVQIETDIGDSYMSFFSSTFNLGSTNSDLTFRAGNTTFARIIDNGDMGIGISSPDAQLHVSQGGNSGINNPVLLLESVVSKKPILQFSEGGSNISSGMSWYMNGSAGQNRLHILSSFDEELVTFSNLIRFGIGVLGDPRETLEVAGNILVPNCNPLYFMEGATVKSSLKCVGSDIILENLETNGDIILASGQDDVRLEAIVDDVVIDSGDDIAFRVNGVNKMFIRPAGRLGINDTSPNAMVDIKQETGEDGLMIQDSQNADDWSFDIGANDLFIKFNGSNVGKFEDSNGDYVVLSDKRLKNSVEPLEAGVVEKLMKLQASTYNYIADETKELTIGFMAQDLLVDFPEVVTVGKNEKGEEVYSVSYDLLNVLVIQAIQEQQTQKEDLMNQWEDLKSLDTEMAEVNKLISDLSAELESR